jgi:hypothetical protein
VVERQYCTPMVVQAGKAVGLQRVKFTERTIKEGWLQKLLLAHPELIPVEEIEPAFAPLVPVAMEIPTKAGEMDLLFVNPQGYPTLVETKLWRNPEARRQVVTQILDYAKEFAGWSYGDLSAAVARALKEKGGADPMWRAVARRPDADRQAFGENLARNLSRGTFLLLIIGDGIREGVEQLAAYLQQTPGLNFTLALVEMALFRMDSGKGASLLVQPRVVARTREVVRAVVRIEGEPPPGTKVSVALPVQREDGYARGPILTVEAFFDALARHPNGGPDAVTFAKEVLAAMEETDVTPDWHTAGFSLKYFGGDGSHEFSLAYVDKYGRLWMGGLERDCREAKIGGDIATRHYEAIRQWLPKARPTESKDGFKPVLIRDMIPHRDAWLELIARTVSEIREALGQV